MEKSVISVGKTNLIFYGEEVTGDSVEATLEGKEKELFKIVRDRSVKEYRTVIEQKNDYFYLENLSPVRQNVVRWLPIDHSDRVLEIGAKAGAVSSGLFELSENITLFEQKLTLARILAERFANCKSASVYSGDYKAFLDDIFIEKMSFDWVVVYSPEYIDDALKLAGSNGHVVLVTDNRLGLKYLAGNKAPGSKNYFSYIEGKELNGAITYEDINNFKLEYKDTELSIYYPYPDFRFVKNLYSDTHLPKVGELVDNLNNYESDRVILFSEKEAFDESCRDGSFKYISNSYVLIFGKKPETEYVRFSNDRTDEHSIYTSITMTDGYRQVKKYPFTGEAAGHIKEIYKNYGLLVSRYEGSALRINTCNLFGTEDKPYVSFEYIEGTLLSELMDSCIAAGDMDGFYKLFDQYVKYLSFDNTGKITDIDAVFSNIIVGNGVWTLIDYEWCKPGRTDIKETAYRSIYCYIMEDSQRAVIDLDLIRRKLVLAKAASDEIEADEMKFQKMVTGKMKALGEIREALGHKAVNPIPYAERIRQNDNGLLVQIYPSDPKGNFSEETSYIYKDAYVSEKEIEILIPIDKNEPFVRIDPMNNMGIVTVTECRINEYDYPVDSKKYLVTNGRRINDNSFAFNTNDPNMIFSLDGLVRDADSFMFVRLRVDVLEKAVCDALCAKTGIRSLLG